MSRWQRTDVEQLNPVELMFRAITRPIYFDPNTNTVRPECFPFRSNDHDPETGTCEFSGGICNEVPLHGGHECIFHTLRKYTMGVAGIEFTALEQELIEVNIQGQHVGIPYVYPSDEVTIRQFEALQRKLAELAFLIWYET